MAWVKIIFLNYKTENLRWLYWLTFLMVVVTPFAFQSFSCQNISCYWINHIIKLPVYSIGQSKFKSEGVRSKNFCLKLIVHWNIFFYKTSKKENVCQFTRTRKFCSKLNRTHSVGNSMSSNQKKVLEYLSGRTIL